MFSVNNGLIKLLAAFYTSEQKVTYIGFILNK
jgi:hypothetical protein